MGSLGQLFGFGQKDSPELQQAIERAVNSVEPQIKQIRQYPDAFRKPVKTALEYAHDVALTLPGPVTTDLDAYARDPYVHAIFPSMEVVSDAFRTSRAMQDYLRANPSSREVYALIGMRRWKKTLMGMKQSGEVIQRDVPQHVVYFTSHTVESPAPTEQQVREQAAGAFFDTLVKKVAGRVMARKDELLSQQQEKDILMARLHTADPKERPALQAALSKMLADMHAAEKALEWRHYPDDFEAVLLNPEKHLWLSSMPMMLDSMGIEHENDGFPQARNIVFNDLIGYDRRDWTVAIVHCHDVQREDFAARLDTAYRKLSIL